MLASLWVGVRRGLRVWIGNCRRRGWVDASTLLGPEGTGALALVIFGPSDALDERFLGTGGVGREGTSGS